MAITRIAIQIHDEFAYDVRIGAGALRSFAERLHALYPRAQKVCIISDEHVAPLWLDEVKQTLTPLGLEVSSITVCAGEDAKSLGCYEQVAETLAHKHLDRSSVLVALGGGVVGDLTGFLSATYMRGVGFIQIPTSLLAMVDSSVGGKTGINLEAGKNLLGVFRQPAYVCADTQTLTTLPDAEWVSGSAEIAKSALLSGEVDYAWLCDNARGLFGHDETITQQAIANSVLFKARVVAEDERETTGVRACLNFGHTLGHALEKASGYTLSHGLGVAEGMRFALRLGLSQGLGDFDLLERHEKLLDELGLFELTELGGVPKADLNTDELLEAMRNDKKNRGSGITFILVPEVGSYELVTLSEEEVREHIEAWKMA